MRYSKYGSLLGGMLLAAGLLLTLTPAASSAMAAAKSPMSAANAAQVSARTAPVFSLHLAGVSDACESSCMNNACPPGESEGDNNDWVAVLQFRLNNFLPYGLNPNGDFNAATKAAVTNFQQVVGISGGGAVGDRTWAALGFCVVYPYTQHSYSSGSTVLTGCPATESNGGSDDPIFVEAIQDLLNVNFVQFIYPVTPYDFEPQLASDGSFGPLTQDAVTDFQQAVGISKGGGVVGQRTWSALGMCAPN